MKQRIKIFETIRSLAEFVAHEFQLAVKNAADDGNIFCVALSGGSTPKALFKMLAKPEYRETISWDNVHLFWGDERNVPPNDKESNFGKTKNALLDYIEIQQTNIHRIRGEENPFIEVTNYKREIEKVVPFGNTLIPRFDWIFLGLGSDGHTASIFPLSNVLNKKGKICSVAKHPVSGQERITFTLPLINNAKRVSFLVSGEGKANILKKILKSEKGSKKYPAALVQPENGILEWYIDEASGKYL
ncbi:6-phosphogluconolactonase [candidate division KSB1 bacterium]|nr:6-phosphogluconolactonase [candidate division KSB1 bacterium]MBL7092369.1 6-phosphogluconolactonase [candidate division KSB1 bacterium]